MNTSKIRIGQTYQMRIGKNTSEVRIVEEHPDGGWIGESVKTGKAIRIKSPERIVTHIGEIPAKATKPTKAEKQRDTGEAVAPQAETVATVAKTDRKPLSLLNAAAIVLEACDRPLSCKEIIEKAVDAGVWKPGAGKTPANTLYSSILREIAKKGADSRFVKAERGKFKLSS